MKQNIQGIIQMLGIQITKTKTTNFGYESKSESS